MDYKNKEGIAVQVNSCGLSVDLSMPSLAANPDANVVDPTQEHQKMGCLEVKCPYVFEKNVCKDVPYFYQVQTQMHITHIA